MKSAIVSGATGFVGSAVTRELVRQGVRVAALARNADKATAQFSNKIPVIPYDMANTGTLLKQIEPLSYDTFYHFAWQGVSGESHCTPEVQLDNVRWSLDALRIAKELGCKRFVGTGSIMEDETLAVTIEDGCHPGRRNAYGIAKLAAHTILKAEAAHRNIDFVWGKITNAYGPGEKSQRTIITTINKIVNKQALEFSTATQNYDFIYIDDLAHAFYLLGIAGKPFHSYILGSGSARPLREWLDELIETLEPKTEVTFGSARFAGVHLGLDAFDTARTTQDLGFHPRTSFSEGLLRTHDWVLTQKS